MTLQKEFYASFIAQRLTPKVINMDTLYLVFKDRFRVLSKPDLVARPARSVANQLKISFEVFFGFCPTDDNLASQAKRHITETATACQALSLHSCKLFSGMKQPPSRQNFPLREAARKLSVACDVNRRVSGKEAL
ncbi:MAG TPA: hypothetical protein VN256_09670 [Pyrinomonadaceae bacterium]|nr:hypothetical protein [Pyrinomonadaceae bacterium]